MWLYLTLSLLPLAAYSPAEACSCPRPHLQTAFCKSDVVIIATFLKNPSEDGDNWIRYGITVHEAIKGGEKAQNLNAVYSERSFGCAYGHFSKDFTSTYMIAAKKEGDRVVVNACSFIKPFHDLSAGQVSGVRWYYNEGCDCTIVPCFSGNCGDSPSSTQCFWTQYNTATTSQEVHERCIHDTAGHCVWSWGMP